MPLCMALSIAREVCRECPLLGIVVAPYGAIELGSIRLVMISAILVTVGINVRVAFWLERREDGLRK